MTLRKARDTKYTVSILVLPGKSGVKCVGGGGGGGWGDRVEGEGPSEPPDSFKTSPSGM